MIDMRRLRLLARLVCAPDIAHSSLRIALVVGTVINVVNQGDRLLGGSAIQLGHFLLNYAIPFCVAAYSALQTRLKDLGIECESLND
jgi:hypothetical protein